MVTAPMMKAVITQEIWSEVAEKVPCMCGRATPAIDQMNSNTQPPPIATAIIRMRCPPRAGVTCGLSPGIGGLVRGRFPATSPVGATTNRRDRYAPTRPG